MCTEVRCIRQQRPVYSPASRAGTPPLRGVRADADGGPLHAHARARGGPWQGAAGRGGLVRVHGHALPDGRGPREARGEVRHECDKS